MKLLIVVATKKEINPLLHSFKATKIKDNLFSFTYKKIKATVLITGVGIPLTIYHLTKRLCFSRYDFAINAGIAGSFKMNLKKGTVVNVTSDCFADMGVEDGKNFLTVEEVKLVGLYEFRICSSQFKNRLVTSLPSVKGITVNTVHGNKVSIQKAVKKFHPDIETMEGAAFLLVCNKEKVPCIQVRAVSNYVEKRNKRKWQVSSAINNLNKQLINLIKNLP